MVILVSEASREDVFLLADGTPHREPVLAARECPPALMPANCKTAIAAAQSKGWTWACSYAIGYQLGKTADGQEVHSVVLRASRPVTRLAICWTSPPGAEKMGFDMAQVWRTDRQGPLSIGFRDAMLVLREERS